MDARHRDTEPEGFLHPGRVVKTGGFVAQQGFRADIRGGLPHHLDLPHDIRQFPPGRPGKIFIPNIYILQGVPINGHPGTMPKIAPSALWLTNGGVMVILLRITRFLGHPEQITFHSVS